MLTAYQIDALRDKATTLLDPVINFLIEDIAERVSEAGQLTGTAAYQVWRAQRLGMSQKKLKKEIAKRLKIPLAQVEQLMRQAAKTGYNFDLSRLHNKRGTPFEANSEVQQIVDEAVNLAQQNLSNIVQTMGFVNGAGQAQPLTRAYQQACDQAFMKSVTGATDYISAVRNATRWLAAQGIVSIDYASGVHTSIEAAVRRNIMGGLGLMQEQISEHNHDALGCDGWEISAHMGSAPDHEPYQGRQYDDKTYTNLNNSLLRRIGTLNCGHAASPIILGVNEPQYTPQELEQMRQENEAGVTFDGKHYTLYEATQRQRKIERSIRNQKRKILIDEKLGDQGKLETDQIRLVRLRQEYGRFSKGVGLRTQYERAEVAGFTWEKGKATEKVARESRLGSKQPAKAYSDGGNTIQWPSKSGGISKEDFQDLRAYAESRGIYLQGFKNSDVHTDLAMEVVDDVEKMFSKYPELRGTDKKPFTLLLDRNMRSIDFAEVRDGAPHIMHINADAYRDKNCLRREYEKLSNEGWFVRGSSYRSVVYHEVGHMVSDIYGIDGLAVMKEVLGTDSTAEALLWCRNNLSEYSFKSDGSEIISEMFSAFYGSENPPKEVIDFVSRCDKMVIDWRGAK